jgi:hypothetical protein
MDSSNFQNFKNGRQHRYQGGVATRSPVGLLNVGSGSGSHKAQFSYAEQIGALFDQLLLILSLITAIPIIFYMICD